jgi:hypothetical protein
MSDYEVTLVNDNMQEFYVRFKGPEESKCAHKSPEMAVTNGSVIQDDAAKNEITQHTKASRGLNTGHRF